MVGAFVAPTLVFALLPGLISSKPAARQQVQSLAAQRPTLVTSYDACCELLLSEIQASKAGDEITLGIYLLEGGSSSNRVLSALEEAGRQRDVRVNFALDVSYVSMISRIIEKTDTLIPRVAELAASEPGWCSCTWGSKPDHGKFALFSRDAPRADSAILGGINFGDRFTEWDDYAVRLPPPYAEGLRTSLQLSRTGAADGLEGSDSSVDKARTIAIASPLVALCTTLTFGCLVGTATLAAPVSLITSDPSLALAGAAASLGGAAAASALGSLYATACDGEPFSLGRELSGFARSLVYDRSWLGDRLAPLRRAVYPPRSGVESVGEGGAAAPPSTRDWRFLPPASLSPPAVPAGLPAGLPSSSSRLVEIVCNRRDQRRYEIEPTFRALFADPSLTRYRIAMAYLGHRWGVELLEYALRRGARVDLLLPERANVYACENLKAAQTLLDAGWPTLRVYLMPEPEMVHAKATLAYSASPGEGESDAVAFLGSANLVRGSMNLPVHCGLLPYDELNVLVREPAFCDELGASMDALFARARLVAEGEDLLGATAWYSDRRAMWEELWQ